MGAWGTGIFENDSACGFAEKIARQDGLGPLEQALDKVLASGSDVLAAPLASEALAAADIVARLNRQSGSKTGFTAEIDAWVEQHALVPTDELLDKARRSIARILTEPSELLELWLEGGEFDAWKQEVEGLSTRL